MKPPSPAIVSQDAVRSLPRWALWLLCIAYVVPGFVGRDPWKNADIAALGYMLELAKGHTAWLSPTLVGMMPETDGLLAYWLGSGSIKILGPWLAPEIATRWPFMALLAITLAATWYGTYYLARHPQAQPVAFAFGGEAPPKDYARALADGALLALVACLGLAQLSHEITSYLMQLACTSLIFFAAAALPYRRYTAGFAFFIGVPGLALAGAPTIALLLSLGCILCVRTHHTIAAKQAWYWCVGIALVAIFSSMLAWHWNIMTWRIVTQVDSKSWQSLTRLLLWFGWPAWPLALWTLWRWRRQAIKPTKHPHLSLPIWFIGISLLATCTTQPADRALLLGLPALAALAAFALPTFSRSLSALIDWFTLLFFSLSATAIWVIWISIQTGWPSKPAANVARLAPGFESHFSMVPFVIALLGTMAWCGLVWWRTHRARAVIWKSLVLPAGGTVLSWVLLMTLWLPLLNYARSYSAQVGRIASIVPPSTPCISTIGLSRAQLAALQFHANFHLEQLHTKSSCSWLLADETTWMQYPAQMEEATSWWLTETIVPRPTDNSEKIRILRRIERTAH